MAIQCEFINLIIPIYKIDLVYPGGFKRFKEDNIRLFQGRLWHDNLLFRDGGMNPEDIELLVINWEAMGLKGTKEINGQKQWSDFCIVDSVFGPTFLCDWLIYERENNCVYLKGEPKGRLIGPIY